MADLHQQTYVIIAWFSLLHIVAVFALDLSGTGSDISDMINGHRIVQVSDNSSEPDTQTVDLYLWGRSRFDNGVVCKKGTLSYV
jgi:hypothetical protein